MGLLDDAIREHLDLKRRRGADPAEVERAEREALGPVRRNRDPGESLDGDDRLAPSGGAAYDHDADEEWAQELPQGHGLSAEHDHFDPYDDGAEAVSAPPSFPKDHAPARPRPVADEPAGPAPEHDWSAAGDTGELPHEPFPTAPAPRGRLTDMGSGETAEYSVEEALAAERHGEPHPEGESEDVLEETPEFLQDTPDHDRLWFEQRPPRDFDFDG